MRTATDHEPAIEATPPRAADRPPTIDIDKEYLLKLYDAVNSQHGGIADFRMKLLALLPIASGAGVFLLLQSNVSDGGRFSTDLAPYLAPIGLFGLIVTLGLYVHELRGIRQCIALMTAARVLEEALAAKTPSIRGAFRRCDPNEIGKVDWIGPKGAAVIIYPAVAGAWTYVWSVGAGPHFGLSRGALATVVGLVLLVAGAVYLEVELPGLPKK